MILLVYHYENNLILITKLIWILNYDCNNTLFKEP